MSFSPNKTPIEVIREGAFGGNYFRDIYSSIKSGTKIHGKNLFSYKILILNFMHQIIMIKIWINTKLKQEHC